MYLSGYKHLYIARVCLNYYTSLINNPGGFTLHMTGYAPACTKSVEKGSFLDIQWRRRLLQKGYIFRC